MRGYLYILECADGSYYTGSTKNLEKRLWEHDNFLGAIYKRKKHPIKLVYFEEYSRIDEAFYREKQLQGGSLAKKKALIEANKDKLIELSKNYKQHPREGVASTSSATGRPSVGGTIPVTESNSVTERVEVTRMVSMSNIAPSIEETPVTELVEETDDRMQC
ncbi:MAG: GIY-YIG nuclease family protein [Candidatus Latescibacterota bacterium]